MERPRRLVEPQLGRKGTSKFEASIYDQVPCLSSSSLASSTRFWTRIEKATGIFQTSFPLKAKGTARINTFFRLAT